MGFPVRIHWTFGLLALLVGGGLGAGTPEEWMSVVAAMAVIFVSILVHELGHAVAGRRYGARPEITLYGMGGMCYMPAARFNRGQSIQVSLAGPGAGFLLAALTALLLFALAPEHPIVRYAFAVSLFVNVVWTVLNLLPILPLDGGQVLRELLGPARAQVTRAVGGITAALLCLAAFAYGFYIAALIAAALAFINFQGQAIEGGVVKGRTPEG